MIHKRNHKGHRFSFSHKKLKQTFVLNKNNNKKKTKDFRTQQIQRLGRSKNTFSKHLFKNKQINIKYLHSYHHEHIFVLSKWYIFHISVQINIKYFHNF